MYFERQGKQNTEQVLEIVRGEALERGIEHVVVASTTGDTGLKAAQMLSQNGLNVVAVTHSTGFRQPGAQEMPEDVRGDIEAAGGKVLTGTMIFHNLGSAIGDQYGGYSHQDLVADVLRIFGQGMKVAVECAAMAADAGLVPCEDVIAVAGTGRGADTAIVVRTMPSKQFFDIKVREILCKPRDF
ncbi:MAG: pyruvate kinase alpha/beta domain-containing protein [Anaerolineae bacterium]